MAAKILLAALAVVCAFGALNAKPHHETAALKISPIEVIEKLEQVLQVVDSAIKDVDAKVESTVTDAMNKVDAEATKMASTWMSTIEYLAEKSKIAGLEVDECINLQNKLPTVVDKLRADARQCAEHEMEGLKEAVTTLEALKPEADALLAEAKKEVAECKEESQLLNFLCLGKALAKQQMRAASLAGEAMVQSTRVVAQLSAAVPNAALCASQTSSASIAEANEIAQSTVSCFQDKLGVL